MNNKKIKFIDLFCGIGGIRLGFQESLNDNGLSYECVLSSDIKKNAIETYEKNFKDKVSGDIRNIKSEDIEDFDFLLGGFPCQAFSTAGNKKGFNDTRGTLFFEVARILKDKQPKGFILENVEGLILHDKGKTLDVIMSTLDEIGYKAKWELLNSKDFGLAQSRKRIYIVGTRKDLNIDISNIFKFNKKDDVCFGDIRERGIEIKNTHLNQLICESFSDINFLAGKAIRDKRGGDLNIHSWDLGLKGVISERQKEVINLIVTKRRYKKWAQENKTAWFDGMPLTLEQIETFYRHKDLKTDLETLVQKGYLKLEHPKDYKIVNGVKIKYSREDLELGYTLNSGKLSFEFSDILDDNIATPTIVATDGIKIGVIEDIGLRSLTSLELKRLFGFPENYDLHNLKKNDIFDLFGNSVTVNVIKEISNNLIKIIAI